MNELNSEFIMNEIQTLIEGGASYIDAIVEFAERNEIEIEVVGEIIRRSPILKARVHVEAEELNMVDRVARLPV
jgi:hypothetical protein